MRRQPAGPSVKTSEGRLMQISLSIGSSRYTSSGRRNSRSAESRPGMPRTSVAGGIAASLASVSGAQCIDGPEVEIARHEDAHVLALVLLERRRDVDVVLDRDRRGVLGRLRGVLRQDD